MMIASAPSIPAAQSNARCPDENVFRAGGGRFPLVDGRDRRGAGVLVPQATAARACVLDGMVVGEARPEDGVWLGRGGRWPARTAATASANNPPLG